MGTWGRGQSGVAESPGLLPVSLPRPPKLRPPLVLPRVGGRRRCLRVPLLGRGPALRRLLRPVLQRLSSRSSRGLRTRLQYFVLCYYLFFCNSFIEKYTIQFAHLNYHSMTQLNGKNRQPSPHSFVSILIFSNENQLPFGCHRCNPHPSRPLASTDAPSVSITHITLVESYNTWPLVTGFFHLE